MSEDLFSVLAAIGIIALVYRWFTTAPSTTLAGQAGSRTQTALQHRALAVPQSQVDRLLTTFPQLTENEIRYALVTTPGGLEAVAERVLSHGGLTPPPPNFFPAPTPSPRPSTPGSNPSSSGHSSLPGSHASGGSSTPTSNTTKPTSLISRLCLESHKRDQDCAISGQQAWSWDETRSQTSESSSSDALSNTLRDRKAKMVMDSRWRLLQKERKGKSTVGI